MVCTRLHGTVLSVLAQTSSNFQIHIIGHDGPSIPLPSDERIHFHKVPFAPPSPTLSEIENYKLFNRDRRWKITYGCTQAHSHDPEYIMPIDADDRISNRLVEFIESQPHHPAWILRHGWVVNTKTKRCYESTRYNQLTGSSCILDLEQTGIAKDLSFDEMAKCYWFLGGHHIFSKNMRERDILPEAVRFPAGAYLIGDPENLSNEHRRTILKKVRFHMRFLILGKKYGKKHEEEFGII